MMIANRSAMQFYTHYVETVMVFGLCDEIIVVKGRKTWYFGVRKVWKIQKILQKFRNLVAIDKY
jgi:hypothetical protein